MPRSAKALFWVLLAFTVPARSSTILDFEGLADGTLVGTTYSGQGAVFSNATVLTAGLSLNELEFPPQSGQNVVLDSGGPITISFSTPVTFFSARFTYTQSIEVAGFDSLNAQVGSVTSAFNENFVSSGNLPNELLSLSAAAGINSITITGNAAGTSFVMDDVTFDMGVPVGFEPEPSTLFLMGLGIAAIAVRRVTRARHL